MVTSFMFTVVWQGANSALVMATPGGFSERVFYPVDFRTTTVQWSSGKFTRERGRNGWGVCTALLLEGQRASSQPGSSRGSELHAILCKQRSTQWGLAALCPEHCTKLSKKRQTEFELVHTHALSEQNTVKFERPQTHASLFSRLKHISRKRK